MRRKLRRLLNALSLVPAGLAASAWGLSAAAQDKPEPLMIQEQQKVTDLKAPIDANRDLSTSLAFDGENRTLSAR